MFPVTGAQGRLLYGRGHRSLDDGLAAVGRPSRSQRTSGRGKPPLFGASFPEVLWGLGDSVGAERAGRVAESRVENAGGGAFVTQPGGGAQNSSVEKTRCREKREPKGEAPLVRLIIQILQYHIHF